MGLDHWFKTSSGPISCNLIYMAKPCLCQRGSVGEILAFCCSLHAGGRRTPAAKHWHLITGFAHVLLSVPSSRSRCWVTPLDKENLFGNCTEQKELFAPAALLALWEPHRDSCSGQPRLELPKPTLQRWKGDASLLSCQTMQEGPASAPPYESA